MIKKTDGIFFAIKVGTGQGLVKGSKGFVWLLRIIIPISFATTLLNHFGIIHKLDFLLAPVMNFLCLPASAAVVLIIGLFTGPHGVVAALWAMPFSMAHMTLIGIFILIAHNLIQESMIQGNAGINPFFAAFFRLFMAVAVTVVCAGIMGITPETGGVMAVPGVARETVPFLIMVKQWGLGTISLMAQIFCIIMPLMVILELAKTFQVIDPVTRVVSPVLTIMGLNRSTGLLWLTAAVFGLVYGAAVIVEETKSHAYKKEELTRLHLSIGVNHAMIEDPALFLPLGLPLFWLFIPRLAAAIAAVWLYGLFSLIRRIHAERAEHKKLCDH